MDYLDKMHIEDCRKDSNARKSINKNSYRHLNINMVSGYQYKSQLYQLKYLNFYQSVKSIADVDVEHQVVSSNNESYVKSFPKVKETNKQCS